MTTEMFSRAINDVDISLVDKAINYKKVSDKMKLLKYGTIAATLIILISAFFIGKNNNNLQIDIEPSGNIVAPTSDTTKVENNQVIINNTESTASFPSSYTTTADENQTTIYNSESTTASVTFAIPPWENRAITGQFFTVVYDGIEYRAPSTVKSKKISHKTEEKLGYQTFFAVDNDTGITHSINATVYSLQNISKECMIALEFEQYEGLYIYVNHSFKVSTLGDLIDAVDLYNTAEFGDIEYYTTYNQAQILNIRAWDNKNDVYKYLLSDTQLAELDDIEMQVPIFKMRVDAPSIGITNKTFGIYADGYIETNLLGTAYTFKMDADDFEAFKKYVYDVNATDAS